MNNKTLAIKIKLLVCDKEDAKAIERALENNIDVLLIDYSMYSRFEIESMLVSKLKELRVEYIFLAGFLKKFTALFVSKFRDKIMIKVFLKWKLFFFAITTSVASLLLLHGGTIFHMH